VKNDTTPNKKDGPFVTLVRCDLNPQFTKGLEAAFEQADGMFCAYTHLAIKNHKKYETKNGVDLLLIHGSCRSFDHATAHRQEAFGMAQHTKSQQGTLSQPISTRREPEPARVP